MTRKITPALLRDAFKGIEVNEAQIKRDTRAKKISDANSGLKRSDAQRARMSAALKGITKSGEVWNKGKSIPRSEEAKKSRKEKMKDYVAWNKGIPMSDEQKKKQSEKMKGRAFGGHQKGNPAHNKGTSKFIFKDPAGKEFNCLRDLMAEHSEMSCSVLKNWCAAGKNGFSRRLK